MVILSVLRRLGQFLLLLVAFSLADLHWIAMQGYTCVEMAINDRSTDASMLVKLQDSMLGKKTCCRCQQMENERKKDTERMVQWECKQIAVQESMQLRCSPPNRVCLAKFTESATATTRSERPPTPPPWSLLV